MEHFNSKESSHNHACVPPPLSFFSFHKFLKNQIQHSPFSRLASYHFFAIANASPITDDVEIVVEIRVLNFLYGEFAFILLFFSHIYFFTNSAKFLEFYFVLNVMFE